MCNHIGVLKTPLGANTLLTKDIAHRLLLRSQELASEGKHAAASDLRLAIAS
jgi:hypothetical protein